jgi:hypothetical protein
MPEALNARNPIRITNHVHGHMVHEEILFMKFVISRPSSLTKRAMRGAILSMLLVGASSVFAQQAPSGLEKAVSTASKWVAQADGNQAVAMWKASDAVMQKNVDQANWSKYIAEIRKQAGAEQSRAWVGVTKINNPAGMPPGEYLNVIYDTKFANVATVETVSMVKSGYKWRPIGYVVRPSQPQQASAVGSVQSPQSSTAAVANRP